MEPLHPPYNVTQPRQLQRWLDVNSQNGPLTRSRYQFRVPPYQFNYDSPDLLTEIFGNPYALTIATASTVELLKVDWLYRYFAGNGVYLYNAFTTGGVPIGDPIPEGIFRAIKNDHNGDGILTDCAAVLTGMLDLVGQPVTARVVAVIPKMVGMWWYEALNTFSIRDFNVTNIKDAGTVTISTQDVDGTVRRYILNRDPNNPIFGDFEDYDSQLINKQFRIEVWASTGNVSRGDAVYYNTSVQYKLDYRWSTDPILLPIGIVTEFPPIFPLTPPP